MFVILIDVFLIQLSIMRIYMKQPLFVLTLKLQISGFWQTFLAPSPLRQKRPGQLATDPKMWNNVQLMKEVLFAIFHTCNVRK